MIEDKIKELLSYVNEQAWDDGLWFIPETAPEDYLQINLRELHNFIEDLFLVPK